MRKAKRIITGAVILVLLVGAVLYWQYRKNFSGIGPALRPPAEDITKLVPPSQPDSSSTTPQPAVNTTGMPLKLPDGFGISIYAKSLGNPRALSTDPAGRLV